MNKLFILVGIAGCGKSTWAKDNLNKDNMFTEIFSSDKYREKLLGDVNNQSNNSLVFQTLHKDLIEALKNGKSVCYDATNLTRKTRRAILTKLKENHIDCEVNAVFFAVDFNIIRKQNNSRERIVPENVLYKMLKQIEVPFTGEGFDNVLCIHRYDDVIENFQEDVARMVGFDQQNPHHSNDLFTHCKKCYDALSLEENIGNFDNFDLVIAGMLHDVGKLYTQEIDETNGIAHYIGHENVGAYKALFYDYGSLTVDRFKVAFYINYHMEPYRLNNAKESTLIKYQEMFSDEWVNIMALHKADSDAH